MEESEESSYRKPTVPQQESKPVQNAGWAIPAGKLTWAIVHNGIFHVAEPKALKGEHTLAERAELPHCALFIS